MANALWRITKSLYNTPHLITPEAFERVEGYLLDRNSGIELKGGNSKNTPSSNLEIESKDVGLINILGPLTYRADKFEAECGLSSYQTTVKRFDALVAEGLETIVLYADGPGGEAYGAFETGRYLRTKADQEGVKLIAYVDGLAASATYALVAAAHEVIINPEASAGSVGVVVSLINNSKNLEKNGYERMFVYAGDNKIPYAEDGSFRKSFLDKIQSEVDKLYAEFITYVADMRDLEEDTVRGTKAGVFAARDAHELGLVTDIMSRQEFNSYVSSLSKSKQNKQNLGERMTTPSLEDLQAQLAELQEANAQLQSANTSLAAEAKNKQLAELKTKAESWDFAGLDVEAYAVAALENAIPVSMFEAAMEAATKALSDKEDSIAKMKESLEAMESLGDETEATLDAKEDSLTAALQAEAKRQNIKLKGVAE